ncbi:hypothetical protein FB45DRAFT_1024198 [Roridomyces roridus]|uniref:Uncharacterized protein n=1 Tax=Roridomyces roridus TaxID=1738132 RepID=A0AAD7C5X7_9AGAR|nr:hypothetical protein FB45DRAFT_1024198 [Roridomyces roridus]
MASNCHCPLEYYGLGETFNFEARNKHRKNGYWCTAHGALWGSEVAAKNSVKEFNADVDQEHRVDTKVQRFNTVRAAARNWQAKCPAGSDGFHRHDKHINDRHKSDDDAGGDPPFHSATPTSSHRPQLETNTATARIEDSDWVISDEEEREHSSKNDSPTSKTLAMLSSTAAVCTRLESSASSLSIKMEELSIVHVSTHAGARVSRRRGGAHNPAEGSRGDNASKGDASDYSLVFPQRSFLFTTLLPVSAALMLALPARLLRSTLLSQWPLKFPGRWIPSPPTTIVDIQVMGCHRMLASPTPIPFKNVLWLDVNPGLTLEQILLCIAKDGNDAVRFYTRKLRGECCNTGSSSIFVQVVPHVYGIAISDDLLQPSNENHLQQRVAMDKVGPSGEIKYGSLADFKRDVGDGKLI